MAKKKRSRKVKKHLPKKAIREKVKPHKFVAPVRGSLKKEIMHGKVCEIVKGKVVCKKKKFEVYTKK